MRRAAVILSLTAALLGAASAHAQEPPLAAKLAECETGADAAHRYAVFTGSMPRDAAPVMAMRFELQQKQPEDGGWERVDVEGWGEWLRAAKKGVPGFIYTKRLERLAAPASYRVVVTFRWSEADGTVVRTTRRFSRICRQPDWRPDLHVKRVILDADSRTATALVVNRGRGAAGAFAVHAARGELVKGRTLDGLGAGDQASVTLGIGRCAPGGAVTFTVDPAGVVAEADETDNAVTVDCPV